MSPVPDRAQLRRDEILDAAERIFATKGYHESGIADIAAELGIGHGTFYRYFKNKHDIAVTILERVIQRIAELGLSEDPNAAETLEQYRGQVERILDKMLELADSQPDVVRFFHQQSLQVDSDRLGAALDMHAKFTELFLTNGVKKGFLRAELDIEATSQQLVALIFDGMRRAVRMDAEGRRRWGKAGMALMFDGIRA